MEATYSAETSVEFQRTSLCCIPEDADLQREANALEMQFVTSE
jgi:hypothetical protein